MFADDFNPVAALTAAKCPRCPAVGLVSKDWETYADAPEADKNIPEAIVDPSIPAKCPACAMVMEWPGCCGDPEVSNKGTFWGRSVLGEAAN